MLKVVCFLIVSATWSNSCPALELKIPYAVVQKEVEEQYFTDGRSYLTGDKTSTCDYSYLESPSVFPQMGRLALRATFHGKAGRVVLGKCIGLGKSFDVVIVGTPVYRDGSIRFQDAELQFDNTIADAVFGKLLEGFVEDLERDMSYPLQADLKQISDSLNQEGAGFKLNLEKFDVPGIDVLSDGIRVRIDASVLIEPQTSEPVK